MIKPVVEAVSDLDVFSSVSFQRINIDDNPSLTDKLSVQSIPTVLVLKNNIEVDRPVGFRPQPKLVSDLEISFKK